MQKISIKKKIVKTENKEHCLYYVPALSLKNSSNKVKLLVPHPTGNDIMEFNTLEEAAAAIKKAGFEYNLPTGEVVDNQSLEPLLQKNGSSNDLIKLLFNKFKTKTDSSNPSIASAAVSALSYLNSKDAIDIFIDKIGEDNDKIRNAAIEALVNFQGSVLDKLIDALSSSNWVTRNSAISCLVKISEYIDVNPESLIVPVINRIDDENPIVQANAILAAGKIYRNIIKKQENK